ncbi:class I SAM-dependent methyltransferase [Nonomuraea diastatica]|nr:class I SAM-dependent methyltransferase [Nonomuraea diastatica]
MPKAARYDDVAGFYAAGWSDDVDDPASVRLLDLLGPLARRRVLDLACGHGRISRALARRGAAVVGVDLSSALIEKARAAERETPLGIRYVHADATDPGPLDATECGGVSDGASSGVDGIAGAADPGGVGLFDAVVCAFGLSDIDDLEGAVATVARTLRPGGVFACSILHPCFPGGQGVSGSWPGDARYHAEGWWRADGDRSTLRRQVGANHRTLATYVNTLRRHGLWLDAMDEPKPAQEWAATRPDAARFPVFLVMRCVLR